MIVLIAAVTASFVATGRGHVVIYSAGANARIRRMKKVLWYLLAGTRGGENRARIIRTLEDRPRNANQLAEQLDIEYNTVRYHLDMLVEHDVLEEGEQEYGKLYFLSEQFENNREIFETITENME